MKVSYTVRKMIMIMLIAAAVVIAGGIVIDVFFHFWQALPFALGVLFTTALNIVKTVWLEQVVQRASYIEDQRRASGYIRKHHFFRFLLTGVVLIVATTSSYNELVWGAVIGLFTFHPAKYALGSIANQEIINQEIMNQEIMNQENQKTEAEDSGDGL